MKQVPLPWDKLTPKQLGVIDSAFKRTSHALTLRPGASLRTITAAARIVKQLEAEFYREFPKPPTFGDWMIYRYRREIKGWGPDSLAVSGSPVLRYLRGTTDASRKTEVIRRAENVAVFRATTRQTAPWWLQTITFMMQLREARERRPVPAPISRPEDRRRRIMRHIERQIPGRVSIPARRRG